MISLIYYLIILLLEISNPGLQESERLSGFDVSPYFDEQIATFNLARDIRVHINAPAAAKFKNDKPVGLVLFALPNGNTIEQTAGKVLKEGVDWHYDIQHIAAQTRFLRERADYNLVVVYLEASPKSWPAWKSKYLDSHDKIISRTTEYLISLFKEFDPFVVLTGHSGGGRFIFSYLDAYEQIPGYVKRISFLDSNYGYEEHYGLKLTAWLKGASDRYLTVFAYNDSIALYKGKTFVSATGGTWYRSKMMQRQLAQVFDFKKQETDSMISWSALQGRLQIFLRKNPLKKILHTVQVERNGFIHSLLAGTKLDQDGYSYYSERCYNDFIQQEENEPPQINIPLRSPVARTGSQFMQDVQDLTFEEREKEILQEFLAGNIPAFLRNLKTVRGHFYDADSQGHDVEYYVFPDYLSVGPDSDYCRIPMGPLVAQKIADFYNASLPTRKLVNHIYQNAEVTLEPVSYWPVGNENEKVYKFVQHSVTIDSQLQAAGGYSGQLLAGIKKDVLLSNKIMDPQRTHHVTIYGWHRLNGMRIQPLTNIHTDNYVDYSHGIRLLDDHVKIDGRLYDIQAVLVDSLLYRLLSDEQGPMEHSSYLK